jgi:leucyl aminopeptidase
MEIKVVLKGQEYGDTRILSFGENIDVTKDLDNLECDVKSMVSFLINGGQFSGKFGEVQSFRIPRENDPKNFVLVGLGDKPCLEGKRRAAAKAVRECKRLKAKSIGICPFAADENASLGDSARVIAEAAILSDYSFENYKSDKKESSIKELAIICENEEYFEEIKCGANEGYILGKTTAMARDLVNEPANTMTPEELANRAEAAGKEYDFEVEVFDEKKISKLGMKAFMEVAKGSDNPPRLIVMRYFGDKENKDNITALVGKGLTYDSGGYGLKPTEGMVNMKSDMAGSASVIGAMSAIAAMKLNVNVVGIVAACENMVSGGAYKNGDIIGSMAGKTIEVRSTDAEGRLTLADAVYYAVENEGAKKVLDIATLTGAVLAALGATTTAVVTNNDGFYEELEAACKISGEKIWRLPDFFEYKELIKSDIADLKNTTGRMAGTITGGLFIGEFVKGTPWIHMDIAGTSGSEKDSDYIVRGATGVGVRSLYQLVKGYSK